MDVENLFKRVTGEAETIVGTWSVNSMKEISNSLKSFTNSSVDLFVERLLQYVSDKELNNLVKLKIGQLIVSLQSFFFPKITYSISKKKSLIKAVIASIGEDFLKQATFDTYNNIINGPRRPKVHQISRLHRKSMSVEPEAKVLMLQDVSVDTEHSEEKRLSMFQEKSIGSLTSLL